MIRNILLIIVVAALAIGVIWANVTGSPEKGSELSINIIKQPITFIAEKISRAAGRLQKNAEEVMNK